jgi:hypothetical protein
MEVPGDLCLVEPAAGEREIVVFCGGQEVIGVPPRVCSGSADEIPPFNFVPEINRFCSHGRVL